MRMISCNGCRVLRKGCTENCTIRPCLQWISTAQSQANATLFLAKFYGRAGLINLINAGPTNLRHETFKSLLYEACARIVDPVHGSIGLMCSGNWHLCQTAVDAVLSGTPINQLVSSELSTPIFTSSKDINQHEKNSNGRHVHELRKGLLFKRSSSKQNRKQKRHELLKGGPYKLPASKQKMMKQESKMSKVYDSVMMSELELSLGSGDGGECGDNESVDLSNESLDENELDLTLGLELKPRRL